jgi:MFS family permease
MNPWRGLGRLPRELWVLAAVTLVNRAGTMVLPFLSLFLTQERGVGATRSGVALVAYAVGSLLSAPFSGRLADRISPRRVMLLSLALSGAAVLVLPLAPGLWGFVAAVFLWSALAESFRPASLAAVTHAVGSEDRRAAFALNRLAINLGMSLGPALGGFLSALSFRWLFWIDAATSLAAAGLLWAFGGDRHAGSAPESPAPAGSERPRFAAVLHDRKFLLVLAGAVPIAAVFFQHIGAMPLHLVRDLGFSAAFYGLLFTVNTLLIVLTEVPLNLGMSHWSHRSSLVLGSLLVAAGFGALAFARSAPAVVATVVVWTVGEMILFPSLSAAVADLAPRGAVGAYMGHYQLAFGAAFLFGPWAGIALMDQVGPAAPWLACFAAGVLAALLFRRLR